MQINKCMGCMEDLTQATCPVCGFDPKTYDKPENALELGVILDGRYLLGAALSVQRGGISYIALDLRLEKTVELFELIPQGCARREGSQVIPTGDGVEFATLEESFRSGIRKAARLEAVPGCAHVTGLFQDNGTSYCVMERLPGDTLRTQVERTGPLPWDQVRLLFVQLAQNMQAFHQAGLVHCGITPDVVRLTREGAQIVPNLFSLRMPGEEGNLHHHGLCGRMHPEADAAPGRPHGLEPGRVPVFACGQCHVPGSPGGIGSPGYQPGQSDDPA